MRAYDNGVWFTVAISEREVCDFKAHWPCSGLPDRAVAFQFDKRNGDLVDILTARSDEFDGAAAVALSQNALKYGAKRLRLPLRDWHPALKGE